ncbi:hypothetical protein ACWCW7_22555 [Nocardia tengchongensis]
MTSLDTPTRNYRRNPLTPWVFAIAVPLLVAGCADDDDEASPSSTTTTTHASVSTVAPTTTSTTSSSTAPAKPTGDQATAAELDTFLHTNLGLSADQPFSDLLDSPGLTWPGYITTITVDHENAHVRMQIDRTADKALGERASKAIANFIRLGNSGLASKVSWIIVEDGSGTVVSQTKV